jgi:hypothetical protein
MVGDSRSLSDDRRLDVKLAAWGRALAEHFRKCA